MTWGGSVLFADEDEFAACEDQHLLGRLDFYAYERCYGWIARNPKPFDPPKEYVHRAGAQTRITICDCK